MDERDELIAQLRAENAVLREQLEAARLQIRQLEQRLAELERQQARQAAPFRRVEAKRVPRDQQKRPGRKAGHPGTSRTRPTQIDEEIEAPLESCPCCGGRLVDRAPLVQLIEELPVMRPRVTRLTTWSAFCPGCRERVTSTHPLQTSRAQGAASVQLGPRAVALATLLNKHLGLTLGKTREVLARLCGLSISRGGLVQAIERVASKLQGQYAALVEQLRRSPAVFADETSWWVGESGWWLWIFTTPQTTLYRVERSRGSQVVREVLGDDFAGMLVSDCLASYDPPVCRKHKCFAHHLRAIAQARERPGQKDSAYLDAWRTLFKAAGFLYHVRSHLSEAEFIRQRASLRARADDLLEQVVTQGGDLAVRQRLLKQRDHLLGCLDEPAAEPTNNRAERGLRPAVIARKLSCGNRTVRGKQTFETLASLAQTCHQNAHDFVDYLLQHLPLAPQAG